MATDVLMPQMGESIAEGTIVRWIKRVGETIDKDEPLFEISTDKVDAEIPAPEGGVLMEILVKEGDTVPVNSVVAIIGAAGEERSKTPGVELLHPVSSDAEVAKTPGVAVPHPVSSTPPVSSDADADARRKAFSSPVVRKIAQAHGIEIAQLTGTGIAGRVTRKDIMAVVETQEPGAGSLKPEGRTLRPGARRLVPPYRPGERVRLEKMSVMRRKIAEHMASSALMSPHVYSAYEVDFSHIDALRRRHKARYDADGAKLSYTAFIAKAVADTLREFPIANASLDEDTIVYKEDVNLGVAVALEQGLIVPVIRKADERSMRELCGAIQDLAHRARSKQLKVEEVEGGTFTITNPGIFGGLWGLPILSQPQVAILAVGSIDKRAVVVDDRVEIRPMCYLTLGYDHRLIDGAEGGKFLQALKRRLEEFSEGLL